MSSLAASRELNEKFNFLVRVEKADQLFFMKCSEVSKEVAKIEYWEGGALIPIKWPGRSTIADITLERGMGVSVDLHLWALEVTDESKAGGIGAGSLPQDFTRGVTILQRDRTKTRTQRRHNLFGCWPTKYVAGEWDNTVDEVVIETMTIAFDRFETFTPASGILRGP